MHNHANSYEQVRDTLFLQQQREAAQRRAEEQARAEVERQWELRQRAQGAHETVIDFNRQFLPHPQWF